MRGSRDQSAHSERVDQRGLVYAGGGVAARRQAVRLAMSPDPDQQCGELDSSGASKGMEGSQSNTRHADADATSDTCTKSWPFDAPRSQPPTSK